MLKVLPISNHNYSLYSHTENNSKSKLATTNPAQDTQTAPLSAIYANKNINFRGRITRDIEFEEYISMTEEEKQEYRDKHTNFFKLIDISELYITRGRNRFSRLPLSFKCDMDDFLKVSSGYNKYKDNKIVCVGRSPKWFLNASLWMKDGINTYDFCAFSSNWYKRDGNGGGKNQVLLEDKLPTPEEEKAYREYLARPEVNCTPQEIVKVAKETGKPVIITDYIHSGCGLASFLDILAKFAEEDGILEEFANSIKLVTLSSEEYLEYPLQCKNAFVVPTVILPDRLKPFNIEQEYHDMPRDVMSQVLINKNTNECRSTYFPPNAWTVYDPIKYKTGLIPDDILKTMPKKVQKRAVSKFTPAMKDFRNLMNFNILDSLNKRNLLKLQHVTR